jgi:uncharacterized membrane protein
MEVKRMVVSSQRTVMYGPLQLFVIGFSGNQFSGEILPAINEARDKNIIRMIDYLFVSKDAQRNISAVKGTDLGRKEIKELDSVLGALLGLGAAGVHGAEEGAELGAEFSKNDLGLKERDVKAIANDIPNNSSALLMIVEHLWAKKIKQAVTDSNGIVLAQGMLTPELVVRVGAALSA